MVAADTVETYGVMHAGFQTPGRWWTSAGPWATCRWAWPWPSCAGREPEGPRPPILAGEEEPEAGGRAGSSLAPPGGPGGPPVWLSLLPYALLPAVGLLALWAWRAAPAPRLNEGVWDGAAALVVLVLARQVLSILESRRLYESLRLAHAGLASGEARYRQMFEANPHPMWVYAVETLQILAVNEAALHGPTATAAPSF